MTHTLPNPIRRSCLFAALIAGIAGVSFSDFCAAQTSASPAGQYNLRGMREVGSELLLKENGEFEYMLSYGAYDEYAKGTWKLVGREVLLKTDGPDHPPTFKLVSSEHVDRNAVQVLVNDQNGRGIALVNVTIKMEDGKVSEGYTQTYGYAVTWDKPPKAIGLGIDMYRVEPQWFDKLPANHNSFVFVFEPGDLGTAKFRDTAFAWDGTSLTVERNGVKLRYEKRR